MACKITWVNNEKIQAREHTNANETINDFVQPHTIGYAHCNAEKLVTWGD